MRSTNAWRNPGVSHTILMILAAAMLAACDASPPAQSNPSQPQADQAAQADQADESAQPHPTDPPSSTAADAPAPSARPAAQRPASFADIVAKVRPAVVNIYTRKEVITRGRYNPFSGRGMIPQRRIAESLGSGFIIDKEGHVLTNNHVIEHATQIGVRLLDDRFFKAKLIGADPKTDVALLQIEDGAQKDLPTVPMGDARKLRVGDWVVAIGNPLGLTSTVTAGITSAIGRQGIPINEDMRYQDFIQTDASINPGNSGGALVNTRGEVVGINTAISSEGQGIGFAIPINMAAEILPQLEKTGHVERSWLGIYVDEVPPRVRQELGFPADVAGARVTRVVAGGPAEDAKLHRGDILMRIDGKPISDAGHLAWMASNLGIGKTVEVEFWRHDGPQKTALTLGALPE